MEKLTRTASFICMLLIGMALLAMPLTSQAQVAVGVSVHIGPPALPVYVQPVVPGPGYVWTPGYWAYGPDGYYWVPGTWVEPPSVGLLWTPGYWGWGGGVYVWHGGYWGPHVGFYGGINYGFGYGGVGFVGGFWRGGVYQYNTAVTNVNTTIIHNTYRTTVINNTTVNRTSFNGGAGGIRAEPNAAERAAMNEHHVGATSLQNHHEQLARSDRSMLHSVNHGSPSVAASARAGEFKGRGVVSSNKGGGNGNFQKFDRNNNSNNRNSFNKNASAGKGGNNGGGGNNKWNADKASPKFDRSHTPNNKGNTPNNKVANNTHVNNNVHNNGGQQHGGGNERRDHR